MIDEDKILHWDLQSIFTCHMNYAKCRAPDCTMKMEHDAYYIIDEIDRKARPLTYCSKKCAVVGHYYHRGFSDGVEYLRNKVYEI